MNPGAAAFQPGTAAPAQGFVPRAVQLQHGAPGGASMQPPPGFQHPAAAPVLQQQVQQQAQPMAPKRPPPGFWPAQQPQQPQQAQHAPVQQAQQQQEAEAGPPKAVQKVRAASLHLPTAHALRRLVVLHHAVLCHAMLYYAMPCCAAPCIAAAMPAMPCRGYWCCTLKHPRSILCAVPSGRLPYARPKHGTTSAGSAHSCAVSA